MMKDEEQGGSKRDWPGTREGNRGSETESGGRRKGKPVQRQCKSSDREQDIGQVGAKRCMNAHVKLDTAEEMQKRGERGRTSA
eukprot:6182592-Pleurochrysis_carterae.AAC.1